MHNEPQRCYANGLDVFRLTKLSCDVHAGNRNTRTPINAQPSAPFTRDQADIAFEDDCIAKDAQLGERPSMNPQRKNST